MRKMLVRAADQKEAQLLREAMKETTLKFYGDWTSYTTWESEPYDADDETGNNVLVRLDRMFGDIHYENDIDFTYNPVNA